MNSETNQAKTYPLRTIYFYLTESCNLACRHCWIAPNFQQDNSDIQSLNVDLFKSIIDQAKPLGLSEVKLTGGEPLLHPQIQEMLEEIKMKDLGLTVETNGTICSLEIANEIAKCKKAFVSISLDGADAQTHEWIRGVKGCFDSTLNGLKNLAQAGLKPQVIMTLVRRNKDQMMDVVHLAEDLGAGSVKFNVVMPIARGKNIHDAGETLTIQELVELGRWIEKDVSKSSNLKIFFDYPLAFRHLGRMFGENGIGCASCHIKNILGVLSDGSYALCGIGRNVPELVFGHPAKDRLEDVWKGSFVLNEIRNGLPDRLTGVCSKCIMRHICLGSCVANNFYMNKNLWEPFWFCDQAYKEGIFAKNRYIEF